MASPQSKSAPAKRTYHKEHCTGDVKLESNDGMTFMIDAKDLKRAGAFFKDVLSLPKPQSVSHKKPRTEDSGVEDESDSEGPSNYWEKESETDDDVQVIPINTTARVFSTLIDLCKVATPFTPSTAFEETLELYRLCDKFDLSRRLRSTIEKRFFEVARWNPWHYLVASAQVKDIADARMALKAMTVDSFYHVNTKASKEAVLSKSLWERLDTLPASWRASICKEVFDAFQVTSTALTHSARCPGGSNKTLRRGADVAIFLRQWPEAWQNWKP